MYVNLDKTADIANIASFNIAVRIELNHYNFRYSV